MSMISFRKESDREVIEYSFVQPNAPSYIYVLTRLITFFSESTVKATVVLQICEIRTERRDSLKGLE